MSGSPKYSRAELKRERRRQLAEARRAEAIRAQEALARAQAEKLEEARRTFQHELEQKRLSLSRALQQVQQLLPADRTSLERNFEQLPRQVTSCDTAPTILQAYQDLEFEFKQAQARAQEEVRRQAQLDHARRLHGEFQALRSRLEPYPEVERQRFDATGAQRMQAAFEKLNRALEQGELTTADTFLLQARSACEEHLKLFYAGWSLWQRQRNQLTEQLRYTQVRLKTIQTETLVARWKNVEVQSLLERLAALCQRLEHASLEDIQRELDLCSAAERQLQQEAEECQLKADQRDAIAHSVQQALESMGFFVDPPQPEHPQHPATALIIQAQSAAGKSLGVSVPWEGDCWYNVDGYTKGVALDSSGQAIHSCDEAETMLQQLGTILDEAYGVDMGEVMWEGKDPNRRLQAADELPTGQRADSRSRTQ